MKPFAISDQLKDVSETYPAANTIAKAGKNGGQEARSALARLWLSEGIPYAFKDRPAVYEAMRSWLSNNLDVNAKNFSLVGSARIGTSLAPSKLGSAFNYKSDLDLVVISNALFADLRDEFCQWSRDFEGEKVIPRNSNEEKYWKDNNKRGHIHIQRGFIDQKMIPNLSQYPVVRRISETMAILIQKLKATDHAPNIEHASLRCYASWDYFVRQISLNLA